MTENHIEMDDLGVPLFLETPIYHTRILDFPYVPIFLGRWDWNTKDPMRNLEGVGILREPMHEQGAATSSLYVPADWQSRRCHAHVTWDAIFRIG